jgi:hypothetical protein
MHNLKHGALQLLMGALLCLHRATSAALRWCEDRLDEFEGLDDIVDEIVNRDHELKKPAAPVLIVRVHHRPRIH